MDGVNYWVTPAIETVDGQTPVESVIRRIEAVTGIPITTKGRYRSLCEGRQLAAYIMHVKYGMSLNSIGERLLIDHSTVSHCVKCVRTLLSLDKKFVSRWQTVIEYANLDEDVQVVEPEPMQDEADLPARCEECSAYLISKRFCELRMIRCYDSKPIAIECRQYHLKKRI